MSSLPKLQGAPDFSKQANLHFVLVFKVIKISLGNLEATISSYAVEPELPKEDKIGPLVVLAGS